MRDGLSSENLNQLERAAHLSTGIGARLEISHMLSEALEAMNAVTRHAQAVMKGGKPVRLVAFNKTQSANWALPWHQDRVIAIKHKAEMAGYHNWTQKSGIWHCEPPVNILAQMMFVRIHFDDTDKENGCLELSTGSHKYGKIDSGNIEKVVTECPREVCAAKRGDILFVKALTLHRSKESHSTAPRRALRVDYAKHALPPPLDWTY